MWELDIIKEHYLEDIVHHRKKQKKITDFEGAVSVSSYLHLDEYKDDYVIKMLYFDKFHLHENIWTNCKLDKPYFENRSFIKTTYKFFELFKEYFNHNNDKDMGTLSQSSLFLPYNKNTQDRFFNLMLDTNLHLEDDKDKVNIEKYGTFQKVYIETTRLKKVVGIKFDAEEYV